MDSQRAEVVERTCSNARVRERVKRRSELPSVPSWQEVWTAASLVVSSPFVVSALPAFLKSQRLRCRRIRRRRRQSQSIRSFEIQGQTSKEPGGRRGCEEIIARQQDTVKLGRLPPTDQFASLLFASVLTLPFACLSPPPTNAPRLSGAISALTRPLPSVEYTYTLRQGRGTHGCQPDTSAPSRSGRAV